jgi:ABC-type branched-subunit amino acid transport system substrate-binding protein
MTGQVSRTLTAAPRLAAFGLAAAAAVILSACETAGPTAPVQTAPQSPVVGAPPEPASLPVMIADPAYTPRHLEGRPITRVAILLPFSASASAARNEAQNILRAAELAVFERAGEEVVLLPRDTGGTAAGAREAAGSAIADGADLILGPLFSAAAAAAGEVADEAGVPVVAFSTDETVAGDGVYLLSFPPGEEVRRVTEYVIDQGATRLAFAGPSTAYGRIARDAFADTIIDRLGEDLEPVTVTVEVAPPEDAPDDAEPQERTFTFQQGLVAEAFYDGGVSAMTEAAARLARAGVERLDPAEAARMTGANWAPSEGSAFQAVLLPEGGDQLRMLAPVLLYEDIDPLLVKFLGTGLWRDPSLAREPALAHGWFAGPDPDARARFERVYEEIYGGAPSRLAGLGYDAASLAALFSAEGGDFSDERLTDPDGFVGVDGLFRFRADGTIERGLAVYTVRRGGFDVLDPAPQRFEPDPVSGSGPLGGAPSGDPDA